MKLRPLLALLSILCAGLSVAPAPAQAQPAVTVEVRAGYDGDGRYRVGHWFPTTLVVANDGADLQAVITWSFPGSRGQSFQYELDLPRGARKSVTLPVVTSSDERLARVTVLADETELARTPVRLVPILFEEVAIAVISSDRSLLNSLAAATFAPDTLTTIVHLDPQMLPEEAALLTGLDVIMIHDLATAGLSDSQRAALDLWVRLGGQLVVGGGPRADQTVPGLAQLLPVEVGALRAAVPTAALGALVGQSQSDLADSVPAVTASAVTPRPGAISLDQVGLLTAWDRGAGRVVFAAFDLEALRRWSREPELWARVLHDEPRMAIGASFRWRSQNLLRDTLDLPALRLPSTGILLLMMLFYIAVVGPVNFFVLRRLRRVELAWVTTPLLVAGFAAAAYGASIVLRGTSPQPIALAIVQGFEGHPDSLTTSFQAVFSPQRRSYRVDFGPSTLVTPGTFEGFQLVDESVTRDGITTGMRELLIDVSALRTMLVEELVTRTAVVTSDLQVDPDTTVRGEVRLAGNTPLRDAMVVFGASAQELGDLRPGATATVSLRTDAQNFPDQVSPASEGMINRDRVLSELFGYDRFTRGGPTFQGDKGLPDLGGVYLLGWAEATPVEGLIDGTTASWQGETLYIIRLGT